MNKAIINIALIVFTLLQIQGALAISDSPTPYKLQQASQLDRYRKPPEPQDSGWSIAFENDILAGGSRDKDYTYGLNFTHNGKRSSEWRFSPAGLRPALDKILNIHEYSPQKLDSHSFEIGLYGFTPEDVGKRNLIEDDRPYASLVYAASSRSQINIETGKSLTSRLSIGVLGLDLAGDTQNLVHRMLDSKEAQGWHNQISDGGELSGKYSVSLQKNWSGIGRGTEIKSTYNASLGYISEVSYGLSIRSGNIRSPWWDFDPDLALYGEQSSPASTTKKITENYFWAGFAIKARAYNAFLQGQFKSNPHSYRYSDLNHAIVEGWAGYTLNLNNGYSFSYVLRAHTSEIKQGKGDRELIWGGIVVSRTFI